MSMTTRGNGTSMKELLSRADTTPPPIADYKRSDLEEIIPAKYWDVLKPLGEPDVTGDPDMQSIYASTVAGVLRYIQTRDNILDLKIEAAISREIKLGQMFSHLASLKQEIISTIKPPFTESVRVPAGPPLIERLARYGYTQLKSMPDGTINGVREMDRGFGLFVDITDLGARDVFKYGTFEAAEEALILWDGDTPNPPGEVAGPVEALTARIEDVLHEQTKAQRVKARA